MSYKPGNVPTNKDTYTPNDTIKLPNRRTAIVMRRKNGDIFHAIIDTKDLTLVAAFRWGVKTSSKSHFRNTTYARTYIRQSDGKRKEIRLHQMLTGWDLCDHKNGDSLLNVRSNLREADTLGNNCNRGKNRNNQSGLKGVFLRKDSGKYRWQLGLGYKVIASGQAATKELAGRMYDLACLKHHGAFARPNNFPTLY